LGVKLGKDASITHPTLHPDEAERLMFGIVMI
jgi:hypothetical protein